MISLLQAISMIIMATQMIRIMGCNAGEMAGQKNKKALIKVDKNGDFVSYTGEMVDVTSIAQIIANITNTIVWAFTNYSSQKVIRGWYYQVAVDNHEESKMLFSYTKGYLWWKNTVQIQGSVNNGYAKFVKN